MPSVSLETIYQVFQDSFKLFLDGEQVPAANRPVLVEEYPKTREGAYDHSFDVIMFRHVSSTLAATDPAGKRIPQAPIVRETVDHPTKDGYSLVTRGWWEDTVLEFTVYSKSNLQANKLAVLFHRFAILYGTVYRVFNSRNINNFAFLGRGEDAKSKDFTTELYVRPLRYTMRLEYLIASDARKLETLEIGGSQVKTSQLTRGA